MEESGNLARKNKVEDKNEGSKDYRDYTSHNVEIPRPSICCLQEHYLSIYVTERDFKLGVINDDDSVRERSQHHNKTSVEHEPSARADDKDEQDAREQVESKGKPTETRTVAIKPLH